MSEKVLQILSKKSLISFAKGTMIKSCNYCLFGKQHRVSFKTSSERKSNILDLVYSDVCGPMEIESIGGNKYFVTFIDDASQKLWVYLYLENQRSGVSSISKVSCSDRKRDRSKAKTSPNRQWR